MKPYISTCFCALISIYIHHLWLFLERDDRVWMFGRYPRKEKERRRDGVTAGVLHGDSNSGKKLLRDEGEKKKPLHDPILFLFSSPFLCVSIYFWRGLHPSPSALKARGVPPLLPQPLPRARSRLAFSANSPVFRSSPNLLSTSQHYVQQPNDRQNIY